MSIINLQNLSGGLNTSDTTREFKKKTQFAKMNNVFYNKDKKIETRRGYATFGDSIGSDPVTSLFFFQDDQTGDRILLAVAGTAMYKYDEGGETWNSIKTGLISTEADLTTLTKWDFAVYKNVVYMSDGVNPYSSYDHRTDTYTEYTTTGAVITFSTGTDVVNETGHPHSDGDAVFFTGTTPPPEIEVNRPYWVINKTTNTYQLATVPFGEAISFTNAGVGPFNVNTYDEPSYRYLEYMQDRLFGAGDDANPSTLYYTNSAPTDGTGVNTNAVIIGGDELGKIRGLKELGQIILCGKDSKIYTVDVANTNALPIDSREGLRSNRGTRNVENSIIYFNERGIHNLKQRNGVTGAQALASTPMTDDIKELFSGVVPAQFQQNASLYIVENTNYYFTFDNTDSSTPNETIVWSTLTGSWTRYTFPNIFDYTKYIDSNGDFRYLFAAATTGQVFEFETGFNDNEVAIPHEVQFKEDLDDDGLKTWRWVEIAGFKSEGQDITVEILGDELNVGGGLIDNSKIISSTSTYPIGVSTIGTQTIGGEQGSNTDVDLFPYKIRIPLEQTFAEIKVNVKSEILNAAWTIDKMRINVDDEIIDLLETNFYA